MALFGSTFFRKLKNTVAKITPAIKILKYIPGIGMVATAADDALDAIRNGKSQGDARTVQHAADAAVNASAEALQDGEAIVPIKTLVVVGAAGIGLAIATYMAGQKKRR